ncbi:MAG: PTS sugar transporter subunit IIA [Longimicrobiales bacterium]
MSDAVPVRGILVAHGSMATGLADAAQRITGIGEEALVPVSNTGIGPDVLAARVRAARGPGPTIIFTDMPSGSCGFAARLLARDDADLAVVCGVNLPMLLDFLTHRELRLAELVPRLVSRGRAAIMSAPAGFEGHADPAASRG